MRRLEARISGLPRKERKMQVINKILKLVEKALDEFDTPNFRLNNILQKAIRIARLRNDFDNLWWLEFEIISLENKEAKRRICEEISPHYTKDRFRETQERISKAYLGERKVRKMDHTGTILDEKNTCGLSISEIEDRIDTFVEKTEKMFPQVGLSPGDLFFKSQFRTYAQLVTDDFRSILANVSQRIHDFLSVTEKQLLYGQLNPDIFEQNRQYVDARLSKIAPKALAQLKTAYRHLGEKEPESRSHALTSCRRSLKSFADVIYPPHEEPVVGPDGVERELTEDKFISRLWQYVTEKVKGNKSGNLLLALINDLGNRIDRIYDLSCKGVHNDVSEFEVNQCVIQTYILIGDILRLADQDSAINVEIEKKNK